MPAYIINRSFNPWTRLQSYQKTNLEHGHYGATACFVGTMRDFNIGDEVSAMLLEHYPEMTQKYLNKLSVDSNKEFQLDDCLIIHRVGVIKPDEPIVLTAAWSIHRQQAFDACRHLMEELKSNAPFWKKEVTHDGERWVHNDISPTESK